MARLKLSPPWVILYREIEALFKDDPEVRVIFDEDEIEIKLYVENAEKADALTQLLPAEKEFGNVTAKITVIPANALSSSKLSLYLAAFKGNPALSYVQTVHGIYTNDINYVVFRNKVVQYWTDNLRDINGLCSTLYQEIAKDVFGESEGIFFCTDTENNFGKPLGEWP